MPIPPSFFFDFDATLIAVHGTGMIVVVLHVSSSGVFDDATLEGRTTRVDLRSIHGLREIIRLYCYISKLVTGSFRIRAVTRRHREW